MEQSFEFCLQTALRKERKIAEKIAASVQYQRVPVFLVQTQSCGLGPVS